MVIEICEIHKFFLIQGEYKTLFSKFPDFIENDG